MKRVRAFARFLWDFVVGDDPRVAAGLAAGLGLTWLLEHRGISAWWLLPATVAVVLAESVWRESHRADRAGVELSGVFTPSPTTDRSSATRHQGASSRRPPQ